MRRDMDLVRYILERVASSNEDVNFVRCQDERWTIREIAYHLWLLQDAGYIDVQSPIYDDDGNLEDLGTNLTWAGNDMLEEIHRNQPVTKR